MHRGSCRVPKTTWRPPVLGVIKRQQDSQGGGRDCGTVQGPEGHVRALGFSRASWKTSGRFLSREEMSSDFGLRSIAPFACGEWTGGGWRDQGGAAGFVWASRCLGLGWGRWREVAGCCVYFQVGALRVCRGSCVNRGRTRGLGVHPEEFGPCSWNNAVTFC